MSGRSPHSEAEVRTGVLLGLGAYTLWGVFPVYFKLVAEVAPLEVLTHRIVWAVPFGALIILARSQWREVVRAFSDPRTVAWLALAAVSIAANWLIYIWAVQNDRILESSLGYYINPLMYVVAGIWIFSESLSRLQLIAVLSAAIGVAVLTISLGEFPWVAVSLAALFTAYGVIRKQAPVGAMPGLFVETVLLFLPALVFMLWLGTQRRLEFGNETSMTLMLLSAGPITVVPLVLFAFAAKRLELVTIGFMQFLGPTLQFLIGLWYGERLTTAHIICFGFVWAAVVVFSIDALQKQRRRLAEPL
ncbi:MAG: EamA family transporter RarD [Woeseiaceae bacterium]|nr:EamA family transporter RarD [Woeseiaceae bacterium]